MEREITTPSILPGFMELLPHEQMLFNKMLDIIKNTYEMFGFIPLDTPVIEKSEILLAKSGGDTEKQIYRFSKGDNDLSLRFDLTVPLARYVAQHYNELVFPFRRYHIGKVYRGERPQKGRFREFYQCDIDIVGNERLSIINDAEILSVIYSTFKALGFDDFTIHVSNRKLLNGYLQWIGVENNSDVMRIIDKIGKITIQEAKQELKLAAMEEENIQKLLDFISIKGNYESVIEMLKSLKSDNELFLQGLYELEDICGYIGYFGIPECNFALDLTIARGLDYYTGTIYETVLDKYPGIGSICSGGRYDNLAENYTERKLPGVGISIGLSRLFHQLGEAGILPGSRKSTPAMLLVIPMKESMKHALDFATKIRNSGIPTEIYFNDAKIGKKFAYADKLGIPFAVVIGGDETISGIYKLKDMETGVQAALDLEGLEKSIKCRM